MSVRARGGGFDSRSTILYLSPLWRWDCYVRAFEMFGNGVDRRRGGVESARIRKSAGPSVWDFRASVRIARRTENKSGVTFVCSEKAALALDGCGLLRRNAHLEVEEVFRVVLPLYCNHQLKIARIVVSEERLTSLRRLRIWNKVLVGEID